VTRAQLRELRDQLAEAPARARAVAIKTAQAAGKDDQGPDAIAFRLMRVEAAIDVAVETLTRALASSTGRQRVRR